MGIDYSSETDTLSDDISDIECPYCGNKMALEPAEPCYYRDDVPTEEQCDECEKYFDVYPSCRWSYTCSRKEQ